MKKTLIGTLVAAAILFAYWVCYGSTVESSNGIDILANDNNWTHPSTQVYISGGKGAGWGRWLTIVRDPTTVEYGFLPSKTFIVSKHRPIIHILPNGNYGISFQ